MKGRGRRFWLGLACAGAVIAIGVSTAWAAPTTIKSDSLSNSYSPTHYTLVQPGTLNFQSVGNNAHTVTATGKVPGTNVRLFDTGFVNGGSTKFVAGSQYLQAGTYNFFCTIHGPSMSGSLTVTGSPTKPRPIVHVRILSTRIATVRNNGKLRVRARRNVTGRVFLKATALGTTLATKTVTVTAGTPKDTSMPLTAAGKAKLQGRTSVTVTLKGTPQDASGHTSRYWVPGTKTKTLN